MSAEITAAELARRKSTGEAIELIDVRTPAEFQAIHVEFARNVPLDQLEPGEILKSRNGSAEQPLYIICKSGGRSRTACEMFVRAGFSNVVNIEDGTQAAEAFGLPVRRGKAGWPWPFSIRRGS